MKIVIAQNLGLNSEERDRLNKLGEVVYYEDLAKNYEEWIERCKGADIICTGKFGFKQKVYDLENVFISLPFVGIGFLDIKKLKAKNIKVSNSPGCNKEAVSEWIIAMMLDLFRDLPTYKKFNLVKGLDGKNVTILGNGSVGKKVGKICEALEMNVRYFARNENLIDSIKEADVVVNVLSLNKSTIGLLNRDFFLSFKKGSYFVNVVDSQVYDVEAMLETLEKGILVGVADDCGSIQVMDDRDPFYIRMVKHPKILATPHVAWKTDISNRKENKMMIDNIEAYIKNKPINLIY